MGPTEKKATRLCDPDAHNLRTCYIQNRQAGQQSSEKANELLWGRGPWRYVGWGEGRSGLPSLELGAHLQQCGLLLHDAHQQRVNVVFQISHLRLQPPQLQLALGQQAPLLLRLHPLPLQLRLPPHQQCHQLAVAQVVVGARPLHRRLASHTARRRMREKRKKNVFSCDTSVQK